MESPFATHQCNEWVRGDDCGKRVRCKQFGQLRPRGWCWYIGVLLLSLWPGGKSIRGRRSCGAFDTMFYLHSIIFHISHRQTDYLNNLLRLANLTSGLITTLAGNVALGGGPPNNLGHADGIGTTSSFVHPTGIAVDVAWTFAIVVRVSLKEHIFFCSDGVCKSAHYPARCCSPVS